MCTKLNGGQRVAPGDEAGRLLLRLPDTPFVVAVSGEPIYGGVLPSMLSAFSYPGLPVIRPETLLLGADGTNNVALKIILGRFGDESAPLDQRRGADVSNDPRLLRALKKLRLQP